MLQAYVCCYYCCHSLYFERVESKWRHVYAEPLATILFVLNTLRTAPPPSTGVTQSYMGSWKTKIRT